MTDQPLLPLAMALPAQPGLYDGAQIQVTLQSGVTVFVGPNAAGKTIVLRALRRALGHKVAGRKVRFLSAGRIAELERFRSDLSPGGRNQGPAAIGHVGYIEQRWDHEGIAGDLLALDQRPDLLIKVRARLETYLGRQLQLRWVQHGVRPAFVAARSSDTEYFANVEASGLLHLLSILTALYDDDVGALLIDEPETSLHPQLQSFLLEEFVSTHSPHLLAMRRIEQLSNIVFFRTAWYLPMQVPQEAHELKSSRLRSLVPQFTESYRAAFFAPRLLLLEGTSDEIIVSTLAVQLGIPIAAGGAQIVPVSGEGSMPHAVKLFRLLGKEPIVLADLDDLADTNDLVNTFEVDERTRKAAEQLGHRTMMDLDRSIRSDFSQFVDDYWSDIEPLASDHTYLREAKDLDVARRRAALATVLSASTDELRDRRDPRWLTFRDRWNALLAVLGIAGCFFLRRGTIENYYFSAGDHERKTERALAEADLILEKELTAVAERYADALVAMKRAAAVPTVDENLYLRSHLGGLLGAAFPRLKAKPTMSKSELNQVSGGPHAGHVFELENVSNDTRVAITIHMKSPLFGSEGFPFTIDFEEYRNATLEQRLPSR
jgi:AAA domain, putative AbiEii toxin, Type IV TA system/AAA domain